MQGEFEPEKVEGEEDEDDDRDENEFEFSARGAYRGREEERDYDRDPEFAEILGSCLDDPQKARSKVSNASSEFLCSINFFSLQKKESKKNYQVKVLRRNSVGKRYGFGAVTNSFKRFFVSDLKGICRIADGGEVEEQEEQDFADKDWFSNTNESDIQQVSLST